MRVIPTHAPIPIDPVTGSTGNVLTSHLNNRPMGMLTSESIAKMSIPPIHFPSPDNGPSIPKAIVSTPIIRSSDPSRTEAK